MSAPYRSTPPTALRCPRCRNQPLPPLDVARCPACGGAWVTAFAASEVLRAADVRLDPVTRWWRVREPCPHCGEKMKLCGEEPGLLQGCEVHGYWIDGDAIDSTGLARGVDEAALDRKRQDYARVEREQHERERRAFERATARADKERREGTLRVTPAPHEPPVLTGSALPAIRDDIATVPTDTSEDALGHAAATRLLERLEALERRVAELEAALRGKR